MSEDKIRQLNFIEQSLQSVFMQRQQFQAQLVEIDSALIELAKTNSAYRIIGNIMVASNKEDLKKDLEEKKEVFSARLKVLEKQEAKFREDAQMLQKEIMKK
ncbi:prefoldin subunit [Candidatus Woesearchaeota archaeon]|nr:prefoldin subunit [Candidatus Woesearchaeota archaeon]